MELDTMKMLALLMRVRNAVPPELAGVLAELKRPGGADAVRSLLSELTTPSPTAPVATIERPRRAELRGAPGSPGRASGTARIVTSADAAARVRPGDVVVCPSAEAAWEPALARAGAIVLETGGSGSAGMRKARERGIPAVRLASASTLLADGAPIAVHGDTGIVVLPPAG